MKWYVLYTQQHHERVVYTRLLAKGFEAYLPVGVVWKPSPSGLRGTTRPLFPRRIFVRGYLEVYTHVELITIPGAIRLLQDDAGQPLVIPDEEVRALQQLSSTGIPLERAAYACEGTCVQVTEGPLCGISGVLRDGVRTTLFVPLPTLREAVALPIGMIQVLS